MKRTLTSLRVRALRYWKRGDGVKAAIFLTCLLSTVGAYLAANRAENQLADAVASEAAVQLATDIEQSFKSYETLLESISYIVGAMPEIDEALFEKYVRNFDLAQKHPGLFGVGWSVKRDAEKNQTISPDDTHEILFIEPMNDRNKRAIGYNMFSDPVRREAMIAASETGKIVASGAVTLVQETTTEKQPGLLVYAPVFKSGMSQSYGTLRGYVYGIIRIEDMVTTVVPRKARETAEFAVLQGTLADNLAVFQTPGYRGGEKPDIFTTNISLPGKKWTLALDPDSIRPNTGFIPFSTYMLLGGLVLTGVIYLLTASIYARRAEIQTSLSDAREQNRIRSVLVKELNHRVKNSLATVLSLASLSRAHADDIDSYYEGFSNRVAALAGTHDILTRSDWHDASIQEIIQAELGAHDSDDGQRIKLEGPHLELKPSAALTLGLAIHELATNAAKYGALSSVYGSVDVTWSIQRVSNEDIVDLLWIEKDGPPVKPPKTEGFGTLLLTRLTATELGGVVDIDYAPEGLQAHITLNWTKTQAHDVSTDLMS